MSTSSSRVSVLLGTINSLAAGMLEPRAKDGPGRNAERKKLHDALVKTAYALGSLALAEMEFSAALNTVDDIYEEAAPESAAERKAEVAPSTSTGMESAAKPSASGQ